MPAQPTAQVEPQPIDGPEMEATHYGITVAHCGEDGGMIALGHHSSRRALAAFNRHARVFVGLANLADDRSVRAANYLPDISQKWAIFRKPDPDDAEDEGWTWVADWSAPDAPGARPVTLLDI